MKYVKNYSQPVFSPNKRQKLWFNRQTVASLDNFSPTALVSCYEAMREQPNRTKLLRQARKQMLFIMGKYDTAVPVEDWLQQSHIHEKSYIHILQSSGHLGMLEEPGNSNRVLEEFSAEI